MSINNTLRKKGQALTPDFMAGISIFGVILVFGMTMFTTTYFNNAEFQQFEDVQRQSIDILDVMVRSTGSPEDWTDETVTIVGLVEKDHVLNGSKLLFLRDVSETRLRQIFGLGSHNFYLTIENETDIVVYDGAQLAYGTQVPATADHIIYTVRHASLVNDGNRTTVSLKFRVWK